jgi:hypothetical protein
MNVRLGVPYVEGFETSRIWVWMGGDGANRAFGCAS